jgi:tRNA (adenine22-N1)-methyltransferase
LQAIAELVPPCDTLYDIGTDHGQLPAFLLREGRCRCAVPCDISEKSLGKAIRLFEKLHLSDRARFHVGDGLQDLAPTADDCVTICGMGARTILEIVERVLPCPLVLSTHVEPEALRDALPKRGYRIERERLARDGRRYYVVMRVLSGEDAPYAGADATIGRGLKGDPLLPDYLAFRERVARDAARGGDPVWQERLRHIDEAKIWLS